MTGSYAEILTTDIQSRHNEVRFKEEFVACPSYNRPQAEDKEKGDKSLCDDSPYHILLFNPVYVDRRLGLIQPPLDDSPDDAMNEALYQDNSARPAVQKVETLVGDTSEKGKY